MIRGTSSLVKMILMRGRKLRRSNEYVRENNMESARGRRVKVCHSSTSRNERVRVRITAHWPLSSLFFVNQQRVLIYLAFPDFFLPETYHVYIKLTKSFSIFTAVSSRTRVGSLVEALPCLEPFRHPDVRPPLHRLQVLVPVPVPVLARPAWV